MQKLTRRNANYQIVSDHKKAELVEALHGYEILDMTPNEISQEIIRLRSSAESYLNEIHELSSRIRSPRPTGRWVRIDEPSRPWMCSNCKDSFNVDTCMRKPQWKHCPNCGASMAAGDAKKAE